MSDRFQVGPVVCRCAIVQERTVQLREACLLLLLPILFRCMDLFKGDDPLVKVSVPLGSSSSEVSSSSAILDVAVSRAGSKLFCPVISGVGKRVSLFQPTWCSTVCVGSVPSTTSWSGAGTEGREEPEMSSVGTGLDLSPPPL